MPRMKSEDPKPRKTKEPALTPQNSVTVADRGGEPAAPKKAPQTVEATSHAAAAAPAKQRVQNGAPKNGAVSITDDQIRERAYQLYLERGGRNGSDADDWFRAESELRGHKR